MHQHPHTLNKNPDKSFDLVINFTAAEVEETFGTIYGELSKNLEIKGFRKGAVPFEVARQHIDEKKVLEETFKELASHAYSHVIQEEKLRPIVDPRVKIKGDTLKLGEDWEVTFSSCEKPEANVKKSYKQDIETALKALSPEATREQKIDEALKVLSSDTTATIPALLVDADTQNKLIDLAYQAQSMGVTIQAYLESKKTTLEKYEAELKQKIESEWVVSLALEHVSTEHNLSVSEEEINAAIEKAGNPQVNRNMVHYILLQQKAIDVLIA